MLAVDFSTVVLICPLENRGKYCHKQTHLNKECVTVLVTNNIILSFLVFCRFVIFLYKCELASLSPVPVAVSLVHEKCDKINNMVSVTPTRLYKPKTRTTFTVCVSALHNQFNDANKLVEFIEVHRMFGAEKFVVYNMSTGASVNIYLDYYKRHGSVDILPWKLPKRVDAHYHAQLATLNDCLYRYMYRSKYIAFLDLDELLVPRSYSTWTELMSNLMDIPYSAKLCAFVFQCVFFRTDWPSEDNGVDIHSIQYYNVQSLLKTRRERDAWPHLQRSKLIVNPRKVDIMGIHNVWKPLRDYMEYDVPNRTAALHHYRRWDSANMHNSVIDETMTTYTTPLLRRIVFIHKQVTSKHRL